MITYIQNIFNNYSYFLFLSHTPFLFKGCLCFPAGKIIKENVLEGESYNSKILKSKHNVAMSD